MDEKNPWVKDHPHSSKDFKKSPNAIYVSRKNLDFHGNLAGAGTFTYNKELVLTKDGSYTKSQWKLPDFFRNVEISYHPNPWNDHDHFQSASIGQEFVIRDNEEVVKWAKELIEKYA